MALLKVICWAIIFITRLSQVVNRGDYLTYEQYKSIQSVMQDGRTRSAQLCGLISKFEDFHTQRD